MIEGTFFSRCGSFPNAEKLLKGKGNVERKYVCQDRTFQADNFDTSMIKIDQQIRKLLEFKYVKPTVMEAAIFRLCVTQP